MLSVISRYFFPKSFLTVISHGRFYHLIFSLLFFSVFIFLFSFVDRPLLFYFSHLNPNIKDFFCFVTHYGDGKYFLIPSFLFFLFFLSFKDYRKAKLSLFVFFSVVSSGLIVNLLKIVFGRYRPKALLESGLYGFHFFDCGYIVNSFPSGHAAVSFSAFVSLAIIFPRYRILFLIFATIIACSRFVIGSHYLSDVVVGSFIGAITPYFIMHLLRNRTEISAKTKPSQRDSLLIFRPKG